MILGQLDDKYAWNWNFYHFRAGVTIDLYLVKNKDSNIELDNSWKLVDTDVEISPDYFTGGADIYHKKVDKDEYVNIGGAAMWKDGAPNLIIAKRNLESDLNIFSPNPSKELYPLTTNWYAASNIDGQINRTWYYKLLGEDRVELGSNFSGEFNLPYIHEDTTLELIVEVEATNPVDDSETDIIKSSRFYSVKNRAGITLLEPVSGSQILLNGRNPLTYVVTDIMGEETDLPVTWSTDNGTVEVGSYLPESEGLSEIISTFNVYEEWNKEGKTTLNVVDNYRTETFKFGKDLTYTYKTHEDGRIYGFSSDFRHRVGETTYIDIPEGQYWSNKKITREYISMEKDENFEYLVNNGLYRVKILIGPVGRYDSPTIKIEGNSTHMDVEQREKYYTIETTVEVTDNKLTLSGSHNLQIIEMEVERVTDIIETVVIPIENYRVIQDMKWYLWNPDHYFPDLDWFNSGQKNRYNTGKRTKGDRR